MEIFAWLCSKDDFFGFLEMFGNMVEGVHNGIKKLKLVSISIFV